MVTAAASSFERLWSQLQPLGRNRVTGGYARFAWTRTDAELREWFAAACAERGLEVTEDRAGNQWGWLGDPDATPGVVLGSHLDSVPDGGAFDGPLGVVSALAAVDALRASGVRPDLPVGVVNFADEEGARFGVACAGSRLLTGALDADRARALVDGEGVSLAEAWRAAGRNPEAMGADPDALRRVGCFVELHIEQGRALAVADGDGEAADPRRAVGIGTSIWPHGRWRLELPGEANHAGTTRLVDRRDALLALASVVTATRTYAAELGCVATVGKVSVEPGAVNAVPSRATAWLDARGADEDAVRATVQRVRSAAAALGGVTAEESWTPPTRFDPGLVSTLRGILPDAPLLDTGAGHDAGVLAGAGIPTAMLFVRNPTGISHSPREHARVRDCHDGLAALTAVASGLCTRKDPSS